MMSVKMAARPEKKTTARLLEALRDASVQLARVNQTVGDELALRAVDLECLDVIGRRGTVTPGALATATGLHPATVTGILGRLEDGDWVERVNDRVDRRRVMVKALRTRARDLRSAYRPMASALDAICAEYSEEELRLVIEFLTRVHDAGRDAVTELTGTPDAAT